MPGIHRTDEMMTQETSDMLRQQYPEIAYGGAGAIGIAFETGPNEILKITRDWREADIAKQVFQQPMDWIVPILEEPKMVQDSPPLWGIRMKRLQLIEDVELAAFVSYLTFPTTPFPDHHQVRFMIEEERIGEQMDTAMALYAQVKYILERNQQTFWLPDIHGGNVGWDDDGQLKVFDLGPGTTS